MSQIKNRVLTEDARKSSNFYRSDLILRSYLDKHLSASALDYVEDKLDRLGKQAAVYMDDLSQKADKQEPRLKQRSKLGEEINEVEFHPAYGDLLDIAAESEMFYVKYHKKLRRKFSGKRQ